MPNAVEAFIAGRAARQQYDLAASQEARTAAAEPERLRNAYLQNERLAGEEARDVARAPGALEQTRLQNELMGQSVAQNERMNPLEVQQKELEIRAKELGLESAEQLKLVEDGLFIGEQIEAFTSKGASFEEAFNMLPPKMRDLAARNGAGPAEFAAQYGNDPKMLAQQNMALRSVLDPSKFRTEDTAQGIKLVDQHGRIKDTGLRTYRAPTGGSGSGTPAKDQRMAQSAPAVLTALSDARALVNNTSAGPAAVTRQVPGTPAYNLAKAIDTVQANIGFDRLQQMRDESKTGGALGSIAVRELELLMATMGSLDTGQSPPILLRQLDRIEKQYTKALAAYEAAQAEKNGMQAPAPQGANSRGGQGKPNVAAPAKAVRRTYNPATGRLE